MYNLRLIEKIIRNFLPIGNIDNIDSCAASIKVQFYLHLAFYLGKKHIIMLKNVLSIEKLAISQQITLSSSVIT